MPGGPECSDVAEPPFPLRWANTHTAPHGVALALRGAEWHAETAQQMALCRVSRVRVGEGSSH